MKIYFLAKLVMSHFCGAETCSYGGCLKSYLSYQYHTICGHELRTLYHIPCRTKVRRYLLNSPCVTSVESSIILSFLGKRSYPEYFVRIVKKKEVKDIPAIFGITQNVHCILSNNLKFFGKGDYSGEIFSPELLFL